MKTIGFFLMGEKGLSVLRGLELMDKEYLGRISFVVSAKDNSIKNDYYYEIEKFCKERGINFSSRKKTNNIELEADYGLAISWRWLIHDVPFELIILHDSLLPKYRGFNPLVTALIEGDEEVGVTAINAKEEFDSGKIYGQEKVKVEYPIKINEAIRKVSQLYVSLTNNLIQDIQNDDLSGYTQDESKVSYSLWRNEDDYRIDWSQKSDRIERFVNAVGYPYKGALTTYKSIDLRILDVTTQPEIHIVNRKAGKILKIEDNVPYIVCGRGIVKIDKAVTDKGNKEVDFNKLRVRLK